MNDPTVARNEGPGFLILATPEGSRADLRRDMGGEAFRLKAPTPRPRISQRCSKPRQEQGGSRGEKKQRNAWSRSLFTAPQNLAFEELRTIGSWVVLPDVAQQDSKNTPRPPWGRGLVVWEG